MSRRSNIPLTERAPSSVASQTASAAGEPDLAKFFSVIFFVMQAIFSLGLSLGSRCMAEEGQSELVSFRGFILKTGWVMITFGTVSLMETIFAETAAPAMFFILFGCLVDLEYNFFDNVSQSTKITSILSSALVSSYVCRSVLRKYELMKDAHKAKLALLDQELSCLTHKVYATTQLRHLYRVLPRSVGVNKVVIEIQPESATNETELARHYQSIEPNYLSILLRWHLLTCGFNETELTYVNTQNNCLGVEIAIKYATVFKHDLNLDALAQQIKDVMQCRYALLTILDFPVHAQFRVLLFADRLELISTVSSPLRVADYFSEEFIKQNDVEAKHFVLYWRKRDLCEVLERQLQKLAVNRKKFNIQKQRPTALVEPVSHSTIGEFPEEKAGPQGALGQRVREVSPRPGLFEASTAKQAVYNFGDYGVYDSTKEIAKGDARQIHCVELENRQQIFIVATKKVCEELGFEIFDDVQVASRRQGQKGLILNIERPEEKFHGLPVFAKLKNLQDRSAVATKACLLDLPTGDQVTLLVFDKVMRHEQSVKWSGPVQFEHIEQAGVAVKPR